MPLHAPLQPLKLYPVAGVAVRVTEVPEVYDSVQSVPQEMPVPVMVPLVGWVTVRVYVVGLVLVREALHCAVVPPFRPAHDHVHGPFPETLDAVPALQRFVVGAVETVVPFAEPQTPFVGVVVVVVVVAVLGI